MKFKICAIVIALNICYRCPNYVLLLNVYKHNAKLRYLISIKIQPCADKEFPWPQETSFMFT